MNAKNEKKGDGRKGIRRKRIHFRMKERGQDKSGNGGKVFFIEIYSGFGAVYDGYRGIRCVVLLIFGP